MRHLLVVIPGRKLFDSGELGVVSILNRLDSLFL